MNLMELSAKLSLDSASFESGLSMAQGGILSLERILKAFVTGYALKKFVGLAKDAVSVGMGFDSAMSQVAATMGVATDKIKDLRDFAMEMGATTTFSATQAAEALNYMALAGYDADKSMATLPTVLNLAAAGGMDLARASDMVTDAESALGLTSEQTAAMVNQMARAASRSNTSVEQLGDAMLTIGGTARFMAGGTDRLQTVLGLLADNGIKGTEAGTHLRNILLKLSSPTEEGTKLIQQLGLQIFDAAGNMRDMQDISLELNDALSTMTQEQRVQALSELFNSRDLAAVNALLGTSAERWNELGGEIAAAQGSAEQMAKTQLGNLTGDITLMKSALEGVKIQFSDGLTPAIRDIVKRLTSVLSNPKTQKFLESVGEKLGGLVKLLSEKVENAIPRVAKLFENGGEKIKIFGAALAGIITTVKLVSSPISGLVTLLGLFVGAVALSALTADDARKAYGGLTEAERDLQSAARDQVSAYEDVGKARDDSFREIDKETERIQGLWDELQTLVDANGNVREGYEDRVDYINGELSEALGTEMRLNDGILEGYNKQSKAIDELIQKRAAEQKLASQETLYKQAKDSLDEYAGSIEATSREIETLKGSLAEAEAKRQELMEKGLYGKSPTPGKGIFDQEIDRKIQEIKDGIADAERELRGYVNAEAEAYDAISDYESAFVEMERGNYAQVSSILDNSVKDRWAYKAETGRITEEELQELKRQADAALAAVDRYKEDLDAGNKKRSRETYLQMKQDAEDLLKIWQDASKEAEKIGNSVSDGVARGIEAGESGIIKKAKKAANSALTAMKNVLEIASPSKRGRAIGRNLGSSVGLGIEDEYDSTVRDAENFADGVADALSTSSVNVGSSGAASSGSGLMGEVVSLLQEIRDKKSTIVLDDGTLVGKIDKLLGQTAMRKVRGSA